jgi:hypothetical protein
VLVRNRITILLQKAFCFICDVESVVGDGKGTVAKARLLEDIFRLGLYDLRVQFLEE